MDFLPLGALVGFLVGVWVGLAVLLGYLVGLVDVGAFLPLGSLVGATVGVLVGALVGGAAQRTTLTSRGVALSLALIKEEDKHQLRGSCVVKALRIRLFEMPGANEKRIRCSINMLLIFQNNASEEANLLSSRRKTLGPPAIDVPLVG